MTRVFEDSEAKRSRVPLMIGLVGPSGGGKTYSALRLATGIQRVTKGEIFYIDTESRRALHYADDFRFRHVPFEAPFAPLDYLAAVEHCARKGASVVVVDSMSHEHEGPGGVLEMHAEAVKRMAGDDWKKAERVKMLAWVEPKAQRRRMINTILQLPISTIFCFRAKEKMKLVKGEEPAPLGYMPIAGEDFVSEMTARCLLLPMAGGVPTWQSKFGGEVETMKLPEQFRSIFAERAQLSEDIGEALARWAEGGPVSVYERLLAEIEAADLPGLGVVAGKIKAAQGERKINKAENEALRAAYAKRFSPTSAPAEASAMRQPGDEG